MAKQLALPTLDHGISRLNPTVDEILSQPKWCFIAQTLHVHLSIAWNDWNTVEKDIKPHTIHPSNTTALGKKRYYALNLSTINSFIHMHILETCGVSVNLPEKKHCFSIDLLEPPWNFRPLHVFLKRLHLRETVHWAHKVFFLSCMWVIQ